MNILYVTGSRPAAIAAYQAAADFSLAQGRPAHLRLDFPNGDCFRFIAVESLQDANLLKGLSFSQIIFATGWCNQDKKIKEYLGFLVREPLRPVLLP